MSDEPLHCDWKDCKEFATFHIEDNGAPWETNAVACPDHVEELKAKDRESVITRITKANAKEIIEKRDYS